MRCAVELFLNEKDAEKVKESFAALASPMAEIGSVPHVTLGVFEQADPEVLIEITKQFAQQTSPFSLQMDSIGLFPYKETAVFLAPVVTKAFLALHERFHSVIDHEAFQSDSLYHPGNWVPHCAIAIRNSFAQQLEQLNTIQPTSLLGEYRIDRVHVVSFWPIIDLAGFPLVKA